MNPDIVSVAPMLDYTDRHFRYLMRLITKKTRLYTEMLTIKDVLEDRTGRALIIHPLEPPVTLQLGGSDPFLLAECTKLANKAGFDEINLNVGCPSHRVQQGGIGACLMLQPQLVADCLSAMQAVSDVPITLKCRLGVDNYECYDHLVNFVANVTKTGCRKIIVHARKAWLSGLSPRQNREIPPLNYEMVYRLKQDFPLLCVIINGGIKTLEETKKHIERVEGVMIGRAVYQNPYLLSGVDNIFYQHSYKLTEYEVVESYIEYMNAQLNLGIRLNRMTRHLLGLFHGKHGANSWRKQLSSHITNTCAIREALTCIKE